MVPPPVERVIPPFKPFSKKANGHQERGFGDGAETAAAARTANEQLIAQTTALTVSVDVIPTQKLRKINRRVAIAMCLHFTQSLHAHVSENFKCFNMKIILLDI